MVEQSYEGVVSLADMLGVPTEFPMGKYGEVGLGSTEPVSVLSEDEVEKLYFVAQAMFGVKSAIQREQLREDITSSHVSMDTMLSVFRYFVRKDEPEGYHVFVDKDAGQAYFVGDGVMDYLLKHSKGDIDLSDPTVKAHAIDDNPNLWQTRLLGGTIRIVDVDKEVSGKGLDRFVEDGDTANTEYMRDPLYFEHFIDMSQKSKE